MEERKGNFELTEGDPRGHPNDSFGSSVSQLGETQRLRGTGTASQQRSGNYQLALRDNQGDALSLA